MPNRAEPRRGLFQKANEGICFFSCYVVGTTKLRVEGVKAVASEQVA